MRSSWVGEAAAPSSDFTACGGRAYLGVEAFGIAAVGTIMCAYFVFFHITHGPPVWGSVGKASS